MIGREIENFRKKYFFLGSTIEEGEKEGDLAFPGGAGYDSSAKFFSA